MIVLPYKKSHNILQTLINKLRATNMVTQCKNAKITTNIPRS